MDSKEIQIKTSKISEGNEANRYDQRYNLITSRIIDFIQDIKGDEIYNAMKDSEYSKDYAIQRIKELFEESMNNEKEYYIEQLEEEINKQKDIILQLDGNNNEYDSKINEEQKKLKEFSVINENLNKKIENLEDTIIELRKEIEKVHRKEKEMVNKSCEFSNTQKKKYEEELEFSKSQTIRYLKEIENLKKSKEIVEMKEYEYEKDYADLVSHIKSLQNDKIILQNEIEQLSKINFTTKEEKNYFISENEQLLAKIHQLETILTEESLNNKQVIQQMIDNFREKSKKFKSKIIEQRRKLEESTDEGRKTSEYIEKITKNYEEKIIKLEELLTDESLHQKELEMIKDKQQLEYTINLEGMKKHYESLMNLKISEMQKEVDAQVLKCKEYEKDFRGIMENKIKALENKNNELEINKEELMGQLSSALEGLEQLRNGYSEQLGVSQNADYEYKRVKNQLQEAMYENKIKEKKCSELEKSLAEEQDRIVTEHKLRNNLENDLREYEEQIWNLKQELEATKNQHNTLAINYENAINEYRNSLQSENMKVSQNLDKFRGLEDYSKSLESKIQNFQADSLRSSLINPNSLKKTSKFLSVQIKGLKKLHKDLRYMFKTNSNSIQDYMKSLLENVSYKIIEKTAENRKLRSQVSTIKKENHSLSNSIANCSKEFDNLSKELTEKQKTIKENCKSIRDELKDKFKEKYVKLENKMEQCVKEKNIIEIESRRTIEKLRDEIKHFHSLSLRESNDHKKCNQEVLIMEQRINELETFLEEERRQKIQAVNQKNREIMELQDKLSLLKRNETQKNRV